MSGILSPQSEDSLGKTTSPSRLKAFLRRTRLPEALMVAGIVLIAVAGVSMWARARSQEQTAPAIVQPTPFPTPVPPTATPVPTDAPSPVAAFETTIPVALPTIPGKPAPAATPIPATSAPNRIVIPSIDLVAPVVEVGWRVVQRDGQTVTEWEVADDAAGFHLGSAYPGLPGNTAISGHHNIRGKVFRYLVNVTPGDEVVLYADGRPYYYRVESKEILPEKYASDAQRTKNAQLIGYFPDERLTLITCWPYTSNTHRVVVIARPILPPSGR